MSTTVPQWLHVDSLSALSPLPTWPLPPPTPCRSSPLCSGAGGGKANPPLISQRAFLPRSGPPIDRSRSRRPRPTHHTQPQGRESSTTKHDPFQPAYSRAFYRRLSVLPRNMPCNLLAAAGPSAALVLTVLGKEGHTSSHRVGSFIQCSSHHRARIEGRSHRSAHGVGRRGRRWQHRRYGGCSACICRQPTTSSVQQQERAAPVVVVKPRTG